MTPATNPTKDQRLSHRVTAETLRQLDELSARWKETRTETIARCIERIYQQEISSTRPAQKKHR